jgi:hypothetical protein
MKRSKYIVTLGLASALGVSGASNAQEAEAPKKSTQNKPAQTAPADSLFEGKIDRVDLAAKRLLLTDRDGKQRIVHWDDATAVQGGELQEGANATVTFREKDGKTWATSIRIGETA